MKAFRRENWLDLLAVSGVTALAATLRFWNLTALGLTHFDEGAYAGAGRWIATWGAEGFAFQAGQSPGLFPALLGLAFFVWGVKDYIAIAVSATAGSLHAGLLCWLGTKWFDRKAGLAAGLFLATCEFHVVYSRLALTDGLFSLSFWAALAAFYQGIRCRSRTWFVAAGALTSLAWNTKYHGLFPLLIAALWAAGSLLGQKRAEPRWTAFQPSNFVLAGAVAVLGFFPWAAAVQATVGWGGVLAGFLDHSAGQGRLILTGPATLAFYLSSWMSAPLLAAGGLGLVWAVLRRSAPALYVGFASAAVLGAALFYMSFPRLVLPAAAGVCLLAGFGLSSLWQGSPRGWLAALAGTGMIAVLVFNLRALPPLLSMPTDAYRQAAEFLEKSPFPVLTQLSKCFYFYGKRPFVEMRFEKAEHLDRLDRGDGELLVAFDPVIRRFPQLESWLRARSGRLVLIRRIPLRVYEPLHYQGVDPWTARPAEEAIEIYRLLSREGR